MVSFLKLTGEGVSIPVTATAIFDSNPPTLAVISAFPFATGIATPS